MITSLLFSLYYPILKIRRGGDLEMPSLAQIAWWIMVLGAVNVGLSAVNLNVIELILGTWPGLVTIVYILIGVSGVYYLLNLGGKKKRS